MYKIFTDQSFFFRGNGSFNAGDDNYAQGIFPPNPQTLYGALRSNYIEAYGSVAAFENGEMEEEIGSPHTDGKLEIKAIVMSINDDIYVPLPHDCQVNEDKDDIFHAKSLLLCKGECFESDQSDYRFIAPKNKKSVSSSGKWINIVHWQALNNGEEVPVITSDSFTVNDTKIGIARNYKTHSAHKGMLYQYNRMYLNEGVSILIDVDLPRPINHISMGNKGILWHMSENKLAKEKWQKFLQETQNREYILSGNAVRLSFLTPSLIEDDFITNNKELRFIDKPVIQSVIERPNMVGGWDMYRKRPKPRIPMLLAGTTFAINKPKKQEDEWIENIKKTIYTDVNKKAGYGRILLSPMRGDIL